MEIPLDKIPAHYVAVFRVSKKMEGVLEPRNIGLQSRATNKILRSRLAILVFHQWYYFYNLLLGMNLVSLTASLREEISFPSTPVWIRNMFN